MDNYLASQPAVAEIYRFKEPLMWLLLRKKQNKISIFPNEASLLRIVSAILVEIDEKWAQEKHLILTGTLKKTENLSQSPQIRLLYRNASDCLLVESTFDAFFAGLERYSETLLHNLEILIQTLWQRPVRETTRKVMNSRGMRRYNPPENKGYSKVEFFG